MEDSTSREKVLKKIRNALISKTAAPFPDIDTDKSVYNDLDDSLEINFAQEFNETGGMFIYCENKAELLDNLKYLTDQKKWDTLLAFDAGLTELLDKGEISYVSNREKIKSAEAGITYCEFLVARLGSIMVSSSQLSGRRMFVSPDVHIVIAYTSQLVSDLAEAFNKMRNKYESNVPSLITLITGPSRTADIEKTLVMGAHGPRELYLFLVEDQI